MKSEPISHPLPRGVSPHGRRYRYRTITEPGGATRRTFVFSTVGEAVAFRDAARAALAEGLPVPEAGTARRGVRSSRDPRP